MRTRDLALLLAAAAVLGCTHPGEDRPGPVIPRLGFDQIDENEDSAIDDTEFQRVADALFARLDTDRNGKLDEAEYKKLLERPRHRRGGRQPWPEGGGVPGGGGGPY
jgi:hypothetical protein